jgi:signal transduction histidine kinase
MSKDNIKEEVLKILELIEKGTINSGEGVNLINAVQNNNNCSEEKINKLTKDLEAFSKDITQKAKHIVKDLEPKLKLCNEAIGKAAIDAVDGLSKMVEHTFKTEEAKIKNEVQQDKDENIIL